MKQEKWLNMRRKLKVIYLDKNKGSSRSINVINYLINKKKLMIYT